MSRFFGHIVSAGNREQANVTSADTVTHPAIGALGSHPFTFPTVLLPATDPGGVGKFSFWSSERPAHGVGHSEAAKLDEYDYMPGNIKEAIGERSDEDDAGKDTDEDSEDDEYDDNLYF